MHRSRIHGDMACWILWLWLFISAVSGQATTPTNTSLQTNNAFTLMTTLSNMNTTANILPLTNPAGLTGSTSQLQSINFAGLLFLANGNTVNGLKNGDIAYVSCESSDYTGAIDASRTLNLAVNANPNAIVLYSHSASQCTFTATNGFIYANMYTMTDSRQSTAVLNGLTQAGSHPPSATIQSDLGSNNASSSVSGGGNSVLGRSPTTAVAMIVLYSITGIITALFLIIIVVGAVRAHRHPERYGPRRIAGRPRQSRAKGIARAMLETLPIVKFGDPTDEDKPAEQPRDIEMNGAVGAERRSGENVDEQRRQSAEPSGTREDGGHEGQEPATVTPAAQEASTAKATTTETGDPAVDSGLACSVCVEDFVKGQDIRLLPCKHKFHPECIDPWLLNVSGTCPLCRVDLRPTASDEAEAEEPGYVYEGPSLEVIYMDTPEEQQPARRQHRRSRMMSILNIGRMQEATPEERLQALRRLRDEGLVSGRNPDTPRHRRRFSRLSQAFGSRRTSAAAGSRPASIAEPSHTQGEDVPMPSGHTVPEEEPAATNVGNQEQGSHLATIPSQTAHAAAPEAEVIAPPQEAEPVQGVASSHEGGPSVATSGNGTKEERPS